MEEIRFHGRGGQGAVTAARLLAEAAFLEGKYCQSFPFFGAERRGAPVTAFARIDERPIRNRTQIYEPDFVVVLDPTLIKTVDVAAGLKPGGILILNAKEPPENLRSVSKKAILDATGMAMEKLGVPITNTVMLGALARVTKVVSLESIIEVVKRYFKGKQAEKNIAAVKAAYERVWLSCS